MRVMRAPKASIHGMRESRGNVSQLLLQLSCESAPRLHLCHTIYTRDRRRLHTTPATSIYAAAVMPRVSRRAINTKKRATCSPNTSFTTQQGGSSGGQCSCREWSVPSSAQHSRSYWTKIAGQWHTPGSHRFDRSLNNTVLSLARLCE